MRAFLMLAVFATLAAASPSLLKDMRDETNTMLSWGTRVAGSNSTGHFNTRRYIRDSFTKLGWMVESQSFTDSTPFGTKTFTNLYASIVFPKCACEGAANTSGIAEPRVLLVSAHYDSKFFATGTFLGAIDSAASCVMIVNFAKDITARMKLFKLNEKRPYDAIIMVFFDGEEAFKEWSGNDNTYGSRGLAKFWQAKGYLPNIKLFVLLDLLGQARPTIPSYFSSTQSQHAKLRAIEKALRDGKQLETTSTMFTSQTGWRIEDDHVPFLNRGVNNILHLIPSPFPSAWHTLRDNAQVLDWKTINDLYRVLMTFIANEIFTSVPLGNSTSVSSISSEIVSNLRIEDAGMETYNDAPRGGVSGKVFTAVLSGVVAVLVVTNVASLVYLLRRRRAAYLNYVQPQEDDEQSSGI